MRSQGQELDRRLSLLEERLRSDDTLDAAFRASRREFFAGRCTDAAVDADPAARRRHLEWFLFERVDPAWERLGVEYVAGRLGTQSWFEDERDRHPLLNSQAGLFVVESADEHGNLWLVDLSTLGRIPAPGGTPEFTAAPGDLLAGRLYPSPEGDVELSRALVHVRNPDLVRALRADLERARAQRRGVVRISQRELERMFFAGGAAGIPADPVGDARQILLSAGVEREDIETWLEDLAATPFDAGTLRVGVDDALGPILDRLAFDSQVDLEAARRALLYAWEELATRGAGKGPSLVPTPPPVHAARPARDAREAVAAFEEKRRSGAPLDASLAELEADLGVADDSNGDDEAETAPDFPGVVGAMIVEFLWETEREHGAARARELASVESFGRYAHEIGVFENLSARDLLGYVAWWLPESGELGHADQARSALQALGSFCRWVTETQEVDLRTHFDAMAGGLRESLPRIVEANRRRTRSADRSQGELFELVRPENGEWIVRDRARKEHPVRIEPDLASWLAPGDRLRAAVHADGRLAVYCCYPPEAAGLAAS